MSSSKKIALLGYKYMEDVTELKRPDAVIISMQRQEEIIYHHLLEELLERKPTKEDYKKCTQVIYPDKNEGYKLFYDSVFLGIMRCELEVIEDTDEKKTTRIRIIFCPGLLTDKYKING